MNKLSTKIDELNKSRAESADQLLVELFKNMNEYKVERSRKFSKEDKSSDEPRKAAFTAMIDANNIPVGGKMLGLQSILSRNALTLVKELGYSSAAYEGAKLS